MATVASGPVLRGGEGATLFIVAAFGIDNHEIHEKNERQGRGLRISGQLISGCLVFVYFISFVVEKLQRAGWLVSCAHNVFPWSVRKTGWKHRRHLLRPEGTTNTSRKKWPPRR